MFTDRLLLRDFLSIQKILNPNFVIEVGAYDADFARAMVNVCNNIYAFEASPFVYESYKDKLRNINYLNLAVSDKNGTTSFLVKQGINPVLTGSNSIKSKANESYDSIEVTTRSLDFFFKELNPTQISLWIDCEGANKEVLMGAQKLLANTDSIVIEVELTEIWEKSWTCSEVENFLIEQNFVRFLSYYSSEAQSNMIFINRSNLTPLLNFRVMWLLRSYCSIYLVLRFIKRSVLSKFSSAEISY